MIDIFRPIRAVFDLLYEKTANETADRVYPGARSQTGHFSITSTQSAESTYGVRGSRCSASDRSADSRETPDETASSHGTPAVTDDRLRPSETSYPGLG